MQCFKSYKCFSLLLYLLKIVLNIETLQTATVSHQDSEMSDRNLFNHERGKDATGFS